MDELIVLNASKDKKNIQEFGKVLSELVNDVFIPIAAGGGIRTVEDAKFLFKNGADKLVINAILYEKPDLVKELVKIYGSQSLVACIDYKKIDEIKKELFELRELYLCCICERVPKEISQLKNLKKLIVNISGIDGPLPKQIKYFKHLEELNLGITYLNKLHVNLYKLENSTLSCGVARFGTPALIYAFVSSVNCFSSGFIIFKSKFGKFDILSIFLFDISVSNPSSICTAKILSPHFTEPKYAK